MTAGKRGPQGGRVRLQDLAAECGVSVATASRALAGKGGVRPDLVARLHSLALSRGYVLPQPLTGQRVLVLASAAAMIDYGRSQFTLNVMQGLEARAAELGVRLDTRAVDTPEAEARALVQAGVDPDVAGLLFLTLDDAEMLAPTRGFAKPVVLVNGDDPLMELSSVAPSNRAAAALATAHLQGLGHRRILFLMRSGRRTIARRMEGWRDRMGPDADPDLVEEVEDWLPDLARAAVARRLATRGADFTAILAAGDALALGAMQALAAAGLSVPGDVSVLGMDGLPQGAFSDPPLSAIQMPMAEIGAAALDLLQTRRTAPDQPARRIELACRLLARGSCGPVTRR